jgi:hypothetical protein
VSGNGNGSRRTPVGTSQAGRELDMSEGPPQRTISHPLSLFLSHSSPDKPFVRWLADTLRYQGARVWVDESEIKVGESLIDKIAVGIDKCDYLVAIVTPNSVQSEWVRRELNIALTQEIKGRRVKVIPLIIGQCNIPLFLLDKKYIDFRNPEYPDLDSLRSLLDDLGLIGRDGSAKFFAKFIAYDCYDQNDGYDVNVIQHFRPPVMEKILRRLWFFRAEVHGMDIAIDVGAEEGARGSSWKIIGADWIGGNKIDDWIEFVRRDEFRDCALSLSYTIPENVLDIFIRDYPGQRVDLYDRDQLRPNQMRRGRLRKS